MYNAPTFTVGKTTYELRLDLARIRIYERTNKPLMATIVANQGMFGIDELIDLTAVALKKVDGGYVAIPQAKEMVEALIQENGYPALLEAVVNVLQHDCGFFFNLGTND